MNIKTEDEMENMSQDKHVKKDKSKKSKSKKRKYDDREDTPEKPKKKSKKTKVDSDSDSSSSRSAKKKSGKDKKKSKDSSKSLNGTPNNGSSSDNDKPSKVVEEVDPQVAAGDFKNFRISAKTIEKLEARGVKYLFPVQAKSFDPIYDGYDVIAQARTGTGKTFSFAIPLIELLQQDVRAERGRPPLVLAMAPTRELAKQVADDFVSISSTIEVLTVYGQVPYYTQERVLKQGVDVIVGTPGRLQDLVDKGILCLNSLKYIVLDEVDRMLDMGFAEPVDALIKHAYSDESKRPQTLLFSATLPIWVHNTAQKYMKPDVKKIDLIGDRNIKTATTVQHLAIKCHYSDRASTIGDILQVYSGSQGRAMVFCATKKDADDLVVNAAIKQEAHVMHGDIPQDKREMVLKKFREGRYKCLVTTDVAARGLDVPEVDLVIQCAPPKDVDSYIHRSGRTGRAGKTGTCVCFYKPNEEYQLSTVERRAGIKFKKIGPPTTADIIKASSDDAIGVIQDVPDLTLKYFHAAAEKLIEMKGAVNAVAAALAAVSGSKEIKNRSMITSKEGFTTFIMTTDVEIQNLSYCWNALSYRLPVEVKEKAQHMRMLSNRKGCVFDMPAQFEAVIEDRWVDSKGVTLEKAKELPELVELPSFGSPRYGGSGGSWGRNSSSRGGHGRGFGSSGGFRSGGGSSGYRSGSSGRGGWGGRSRGGGGFSNRNSRGGGRW